MPDPRDLAAGDAAPAFSLLDQDGKTVRLADFAGRHVVLYFYPKADTPGCTVEACEFTSELAAFRKAKCDVVGISPDEPAALKKFETKHRLGVRLAGDPTLATLRAYGAFGTKKLYGRSFEGVIRSTVIVGPDGRIARRWKTARAKGHAAAVLAAVRDLSAKR